MRASGSARANFLGVIPCWSSSLRGAPLVVGVIPEYSIIVDVLLSRGALVAGLWHYNAGHLLG